MLSHDKLLLAKKRTAEGIDGIHLQSTGHTLPLQALSHFESSISQPYSNENTVTQMISLKVVVKREENTHSSISWILVIYFSKQGFLENFAGICLL